MGFSRFSSSFFSSYSPHTMVNDTKPYHSAYITILALMFYQQWFDIHKYFAKTIRVYSWQHHVILIQASSFINMCGPPVNRSWSFRDTDWTFMVVGVLLLWARRPGIRCQTVFTIQLQVSFFAKYWRDILSALGFFVRMHYINQHFTYLWFINTRTITHHCTLIWVKMTASGEWLLPNTWRAITDDHLVAETVTESLIV